jgi:preprotein translocase subunit SecE
MDKISKQDTKSAQANPNKKKRRSPIRFLKEVVAELKKVSWPTRIELFSAVGAVMVFILLVGILVGVIDFALSEGIKLLTA